MPGKPQFALEAAEPYPQLQAHPSAQVQEVSVTEEGSDEDDANWVGSLNMKPAERLERALLSKVEAKSATGHDLDQLSEVKARLKELRKKEKTRSAKEAKRAQHQQQFQTQPQQPAQPNMMPIHGYGNM